MSVNFKWCHVYVGSVLLGEGMLGLILQAVVGFVFYMKYVKIQKDSHEPFGGQLLQEFFKSHKKYWPKPE